MHVLSGQGGRGRKEIAEFRMTVHLFGAVSSPSCACYALRRTADDHQDSFPEEVLDTVRRNFYVDDCLKSSPSVEKAVHIVNDLGDLFRKEAFILKSGPATAETSCAKYLRRTNQKM